MSGRQPFSVKQWREEIDRRLDEARPDRYRADDTSWMKPVFVWAGENMPSLLRHHVTRGGRIPRTDAEDEDAFG